MCSRYTHGICRVSRAKSQSHCVNRPGKSGGSRTRRMEPWHTTHQDPNDGTRPSFGSGQSGARDFEAVDRAGERHGVVTRVAQQLGIGTESLRNWVRQAEVDRGERRGTTTADAQRMAELEREVRELRRANEILKAASVFFATELDGRRPR